MNNTRFNIQRVIAVSAVAMAIPLGAYAAHHEPMGPDEEGKAHHHGARMHDEMEMLKKLDLTEAQKAQVQTLMQGQKEKMKAAMVDREKDREEMRALVETDSFDRALATRKIEQQQAKDLEMKLSMLQTQHAIYKLLTPEQRAKAAQFKQETFTHKR